MSKKVHSAKRNFEDALDLMQDAQKEIQKARTGEADSFEEMLAKEACFRQRVQALRQAHMFPENS